MEMIRDHACAGRNNQIRAQNFFEKRFHAAEFLAPELHLECEERTDEGWHSPATSQLGGFDNARQRRRQLML